MAGCHGETIAMKIPVIVLLYLAASLAAGVVSAEPPAGAPTPIAPAAVADTPAVAVVRQFLTARSAGHYSEAYALLSASSRQNVTAKEFAAGSPPPPSEARQMPAPMFVLIALLADTRNALNYTFTLVGPDPTDPNAALVRADPPAGTVDLPAFTLRLLTVSDPTARAPRVDILGSLERAAPKEFAEAREKAKRAASQSNLKQLSLGILQYMQDHDEHMPDADKWVDEIMPYVKSEAIFHDPSAPTGEKWSYAYNRTLSHKSVAQLDSPATTVMLFESSKGMKNASDTGQSVPRPGRHQGGTDYGFADGHIKWFTDGTTLSYKLSGK